MYQICPKCNYARRHEDTARKTECPSCGLIFEKWMRQRFRPPEELHPDKGADPNRSRWRLIINRLLHVKPQEEPAAVYGRAVLYVGFLVWGCQFISMDYSQLHGGIPEINGSFMHRVNLVFHEAGHILLIPFGRFMAVLGGSLGQLLMPLAVIVVFLFKTQDTFGASVGLWWLSQSLMDLAPYIYDARNQEMILLGGVTGRDAPGYHDWQNILAGLGWLEYDHALAGLVHGLGILLMLVSFFWGAYVLYVQYRSLRN